MSCVVACIDLGVDVFLGSPCPPLYIWGDRVIWKVLAEYSWSSTTTQSGSFLCTAASSTPNRVVTKELRCIYELSLTLEHSMPVSSPAAPGLTETSNKQIKNILQKTVNAMGKGWKSKLPEALWA